MVRPLIVMLHNSVDLVFQVGRRVEQAATDGPISDRREATFDLIEHDEYGRVQWS